jgi:hypothetical protein
LEFNALALGLEFNALALGVFKLLAIKAKALNSIIYNLRILSLISNEHSRP